jgi:hypothetical protein
MDIADVEVVVVYGIPKTATELYQVVRTSILAILCYVLFHHIIVVWPCWSQWVPC